MLHSEHTVEMLAQASLLHAGRPTVVTVGAGAEPVRTIAGELASTSGVDLPLRPVSLESPGP